MSLHFTKTRGYLSRTHEFLFRLLDSLAANILICASLKICHKYVKFWQDQREKDICFPRSEELCSFFMCMLQHCGTKIFERASKGSVRQIPFSKARPTLGIGLPKTSSSQRFCTFYGEHFPVFYCSFSQKVFPKA